MIDETTKCDVCGVQRKEVNHWYLVRANRSGLHFPRKRALGDKDVCGQACAHLLLDRWLATGSIEKQMTEGTPKLPRAQQRGAPSELQGIDADQGAHGN